MPILGFINIILAFVSAFSQKANKSTFVKLLIAAILLVTAGLITRFGNQPINAEVMRWSISNVPRNWSELRDEWWQFHIGRTIVSLIAFCLIVLPPSEKTKNFLIAGLGYTTFRLPSLTQGNVAKAFNIRGLIDQRLW